MRRNRPSRNRFYIGRRPPTAELRRRSGPKHLRRSGPKPRRHSAIKPLLRSATKPRRRSATKLRLLPRIPLHPKLRKKKRNRKMIQSPLKKKFNTSGSPIKIIKRLRKFIRNSRFLKPESGVDKAKQHEDDVEAAKNRLNEMKLKLAKQKDDKKKSSSHHHHRKSSSSSSNHKSSSSSSKHRRSSHHHHHKNDFKGFSSDSLKKTRENKRFPRLFIKRRGENFHHGGRN